MGPLLVLSSLLLAPMLAVAVANLVSAPKLDRHIRPPGRGRRVSVLVPARDEARNLRSTLPALLAVSFPDLEIIILDDQSSDETAEVVASFAAQSGGRLRCVPGSPPPPGWTGKNWACHQLAQLADGDILLFCDADVTPRPEAVTRTIAAMEHHRADVITALPRMKTGGWLLTAMVPVIAQLPVAALLPLALVPRVRMPGLSMANGQWIAFTRKAYEAVGGHAAARSVVVEDVALGNLTKRNGLRLVVAAAPESLEVQMYEDFAGARAGFRKNLYPLIGGRPSSLIAAVVIHTLTMILPWVALIGGGSGAFFPFALLLGVRAVAGMLFGHGWASVALHPVGSLVALALAIDSAAAARKGTSWKGRDLPAVSSPWSTSKEISVRSDPRPT